MGIMHGRPYGSVAVASRPPRENIRNMGEDDAALCRIPKEESQSTVECMQMAAQITERERGRRTGVRTEGDRALDRGQSERVTE